MIEDDTNLVVPVMDKEPVSVVEKEVIVNNVSIDPAYAATESLVTAMDSFKADRGVIRDDLHSSESKFLTHNYTHSLRNDILPPPKNPEKLEPAKELETFENTDDFGRPLEVPSTPTTTGHGLSGNTKDHLGNDLPSNEKIENLDSQRNVHIESRTPSLKEKSPSIQLTNIEPIDTTIHTVIEKYKKLPFMKFRLYILAVLLPLCLILPTIITGYIIGCYTCFVAYLYFHVNEPQKPPTVKPIVSKDELKHVEAKKAQTDLQVIEKTYKGWMNILNEPYNVHTSCYKDIQSVLVQLEGPRLRISRPERLVMKHCTHDDPTFAEDYPPMLSESCYDLTNAKIKLRPKKLSRLRWWVRRYPICIILASPDDKMHVRDDEKFVEIQNDIDSSTSLINRPSKQLGVATDDAVNIATMADRFDYPEYETDESDDDDDFELDSDEEEQVEMRATASTDELTSLKKNFPGPNTRTSRTIHLFARTPREKERWFHVLRKAANKYSTPPHESDALGELEDKLLLPEGWSMPSNMNKHYFLYLLQEYRYEKHLNRVLTDSVDNRSKLNTLIANDGIVNMDLGRLGWHRAAHYLHDDLVVLLNMFGSRILFDFYHDKDWCELIRGKIQAKIAAVHLPHFIDTLEVKDFDMGNVVPVITKVYKPVVDDWGLWVDIDLHYEGSLKMSFESYVDFTKLSSKPNPLDTNPATGHENGPHYKGDIRDDAHSYEVEGRPCSPEMSPDEDFDAKVTLKPKKHKKSKKNTAEKVLGVMNKVVKSDAFKKVTKLKPIKKTMEKLSSTPLAIHVEVTGMKGTMAINIPPPPSDRLWYAFREPPMLTIKSIPQIGDRTVDFEKVSDWIETNIRELLYKLLVMPNMDDIPIPVLEGNELITGTLNK